MYLHVDNFFCGANNNNIKAGIYIGSQAKALKLFGTAFPRLTDILIKRFMPQTQYKHESSNPPEESNLYKPGYGLHERGTNIGWRRSSIIYVKVSKNPVDTNLTPLISITTSVDTGPFYSINRIGSLWTKKDEININNWAYLFYIYCIKYLNFTGWCCFNQDLDVGFEKLSVRETYIICYYMMYLLF